MLYEERRNAGRRTADALCNSICKTRRRQRWDYEREPIDNDYVGPSADIPWSGAQMAAGKQHEKSDERKKTKGRRAIKRWSRVTEWADDELPDVGSEQAARLVPFR